MTVQEGLDARAAAPLNDASRALWRATDALLGHATVEGALAHKLGPLAAARMRRLGDPLPAAFRAEERAAVLGMRTVVPLLERIRDASDGPLVVLKGPEVASLYPSRARRFSDVDVLTADAPGLDRSLRQQGFVEAPELQGTPEEHHHLEALRWPTLSLTVEVHSTPNWLASMRPPSRDEILEASVPSALGIEGVRAPTPLHHTLILVSHAWRDEPLHTIRDLVDIAAFAALVDRAELDRTAEAWGIDRVWRTTRHAVEHLFFDGPGSFPLRSWARHLELVRERSVIENHLARWLSAFSELPPHRALARSAQVARAELVPAAGETWRAKAGRMTRAVRNPTAPVVRRRPRRRSRTHDHHTTGT